MKKVAWNLSKKTTRRVPQPLGLARKRVDDKTPACDLTGSAAQGEPLHNRRDVWNGRAPYSFEIVTTPAIAVEPAIESDDSGISRAGDL